MKKKQKKNKVFFKVILFVVIGYFGYAFISQQISLNKYTKEFSYYENKKQEETIRNEELNKEKENIDSDDYIEELAREKLGLVMPNETIYIDSNRY